MIDTSWNCRVKTWVNVILSRVRILDGLLLVNKLDDDLTKYQISDSLQKEEKLSNLDEEFCIDINWEQNKVGLVSLINKNKTITNIIEK